MSEDSDDMDGEDESLDEDLEEGRQFFGNLPVPSWLRMSLTEAGFENPSPIQAAAMKRIAKGKDIIVHAATGSGKTLAFMVPLLATLRERVPFQALLLVPSRELALQTASIVDGLLQPSRPLSPVLLLGGLPLASARRSVQTPRPRRGDAIGNRADSAAGAADAADAANAHDSDDGSADALAMQQLRDLEREVSRGRAEIVITTPSTLRRLVALDSQLRASVLSGVGDGAKLANRARLRAPPNGLLSRLARSLDTLVLDEIDVLLPRPLLEGADFFAEADWKRATREQRDKARKKAGKVSMFIRALIRMRSGAPHEQRVPDRPKHLRGKGQSARRGRKLQIVGASATVSRVLVESVTRMLEYPKPPKVVSAKHLDDWPQGIETTLAERGVGKVSLNRTLRHFYVEADTDARQATAATLALRELGSRCALLVLPKTANVSSWRDQLRAAGLERAELLHVAMGFITRETSGVDLNDDAASHLLRRFERMEPLVRGGDVAAAHAHAAMDRQTEAGESSHERACKATASTTAETTTKEGKGPAVEQKSTAFKAESDSSWEPRVLVTTEPSVRGLDLRGLDCVMLLYVPYQSDTYLHLAGRVGRGSAIAREGHVVTVTTAKDAKYLNLFTSQLGMSLKKLKSVQDQVNRIAEDNNPERS